MHENGFAEIDEMSLKRLERFKYGCKDRFNFEIDTIEVPPDGKAARIMRLAQRMATSCMLRLHVAIGS
jgi:hypothetical protein